MYCSPAKDDPAALLTPHEIGEAVGAFVRLGVDKVRITGGEPLCRQDLADIIRRLSAIPGTVSYTHLDVYKRQDLVRVRTSMAKKMGFSSYVNSSFVDLGYLMMDRLDYGQEQVAAFRKQVREVIVPLCTQLYERQAKRMGVYHLKYYYEAFSFPTGNAEMCIRDSF